MTFPVSLPRQLPKLKRPDWLKVPNLSRDSKQVTAQAVGVLSVLVGVSMWSVPSAFILGGLTLVFAIERQG